MIVKTNLNPGNYVDHIFFGIGTVILEAYSGYRVQYLSMDYWDTYEFISKVELTEDWVIKLWVESIAGHMFFKLSCIPDCEYVHELQNYGKRVCL
jgi:hypothetical protein